MGHAEALQVEDVTVRFGGVTALDGPSFSVPRGSVCGLIGPNGAGKTTLFNCVSRLYTPVSGAIRFDGDDLLAQPAHRIAPLGIARTFQNLGLVPSLTVRDNVLVGAHHRMRATFATAALRLPAVRREERERAAEADAALSRLGLEDVAGRPAAGLPYGTLKRVELARALCARPKLLLLDEPASGLNHSEVGELADLLLELRSEHDLTILLVEHHMGMVMRICDHVVVLNFGKLIAQGAPDEVKQDPAVVEAYLGNAGVSLLEARDLEAGYGQGLVLHKIAFDVPEGRMVSILGSNGAGKTTALRAISGMVQTHGSIRFDGSELVGRAPDAIARAGIAHVPQGRGTFAHLTVEENLRVGAYARRDDGVRGDIDRCYGWFPRLGERAGQHAGSLSGGEQQMLAVARALMMRPRLLLLDEPSLGLAPLVTRELFGILETIAREEHITVLIVEQNANLVLQFADYAYVLESGRIALEGDAATVQADEGVRRSYLGA